MADFTPKQGQYLAFIHAYTEGFGYPPAESEIAEAITDPNHEEHEELLEWRGPFDPAEFNAEQATRRMRAGLPGW